MFDNVCQCPKMSGNVRRHFRTCYDMSHGYFRQYPALYLEMIFHGPDFFNGTNHDQCTNHINSAAQSTSAQVPEHCTRYRAVHYERVFALLPMLMPLSADKKHSLLLVTIFQASVALPTTGRKKQPLVHHLEFIEKRHSRRTFVIELGWGPLKKKRG